MRSGRFIRRALGGACVALALTGVSHAQEVHEDMPEYEAVAGISGSINSIGSDTMNNMMGLWAEGFRTYYPSVQVEISGAGSSTAPPALREGAANFGPMSRQMRDSEIDEFEEEFGYPPVALPVAVDMLAVYVHRDNPIEGLTLPQVDAIFSSTRRGGYDQNITRWSQLGVGGSLGNQPISIYGRNAASGTYGYFKQNALFGGDFKNSVREQPGSSSVVQGVASERNAIGYSGIGYKTADVRAVPLAASADEPFYEATAEHAARYPLARFLYIYVNYRPGSELDPLRREFIKYVYSRAGQEDVLRDGYIPVTPHVAREALQRVGLEFPEPEPDNQSENDAN